MSVAQHERWRTARREQRMVNQPLTCILSVSLEPGRRIAQTKAITPGIHVAHQALTPDASYLVSQNELQVADRRFFEDIATGIRLQLPAALARHADDVAGFVQQ